MVNNGASNGSGFGNIKMGTISGGGNYAGCITMQNAFSNPSATPVTGGSIIYADNSTGYFSILPPATTLPTLSVGAGTTVFRPNSLSGTDGYNTGSPVTGNQIISQLVSQQTTTNTPVNAISIPLPGTTGAPITTGTVWIDATIVMSSTTTAVAATFKLSWGWAVQISGSPVALGTLVTALSTGTNSGSPPVGWSASISLDSGSLNVLVVITGPNSLTVNSQVSTESRYIA